jgi:hypothetical protein
LTLPNPQHLLQQATRLSTTTPSGGPLRQTDLRRAISNAYYGVFHATLAAAADQFVGTTKRSTIQYALVYRSIDHRALRELCLEMRKRTLPRLLARHSPPGGFGPHLTVYSEFVLELQEKRISADYDPLKRYQRSDSLSAIAVAQLALSRFKAATDAERQAFLALLVFKPR